MNRTYEWAWNQPISPREKLVLLALVVQSENNKNFTVDIKKLCDMTLLTSYSLNLEINSLIKAHLINCEGDIFNFNLGE